MTAQQSIAARRKARQDLRYANQKRGDVFSRDRRLREKIERERTRAQRQRKKK